MDPHYKQRDVIEEDRLRAGQGTDLLETGLHDLGPVVDGQDDIGDASIGESGDLVLNDGLVGELDQRLGQSEGLSSGARVSSRYIQRGRGAALHCSEEGQQQQQRQRTDVREGGGGCQSHRRE